MMRTLQIHVWGGFGSQLNGLAAAIEIQKLLPGRKMELIFHSSGLTRRKLEISELLEGKFCYSERDDFKFGLNEKHSKNISRIPLLRKVSVYILEKLRLIIKAEDIEDLSQIKPWTQHLRGHYAYCKFSSSTLQAIVNIVTQTQTDMDVSNSTVLHYRLGDLLQLQKGSIRPEEIVKLINILDSTQPILVYTESVSEAYQRLKSGLDSRNVSYFGPERRSIEVLHDCIQAGLFIGTNSKISLWATILRSHGGKRGTYLPSELRLGLTRNLNSEQLDLIGFY